MSTSEIQVEREENHFRVRSSLSSHSSCMDCCSVQISLLKWEECDTIGKIFGYAIGKIVNFTVENGKKLIQNTIQLFYLDKVAEYFSRFMNRSVTTLYDGCARVSEFVSNCFEKVYYPIKRSIVWTYNNIVSPVLQPIQRVVKYIFKTLLWDSIITPLYNRIIYPILEKLFVNSNVKDCVESEKNNGFFQKIFEWHQCILEKTINGLKKISDWTIVPLYSNVVRPAVQMIGEFIHGVLSGSLTTNPNEIKENQEEKEANNSVQEDELEIKDLNRQRRENILRNRRKSAKSEMDGSLGNDES